MANVALQRCTWRSAYKTKCTYIRQLSTSTRIQNQNDSNNNGGDKKLPPHQQSMSASSYLFSQAEIEDDSKLDNAAKIERDRLAKRIQDVPWDGDERLEDSVLRMLIDKNKVLRIPGSERKTQDSLSEQDNDNLLFSNHVQQQPSDNHNHKDKPNYPWEHDFKPPKQAIIKSIPSIVVENQSKFSNYQKNASTGQRIDSLKDATVDYKSKQHEKDKKQQNVRRPMPKSTRALHNLVEEQIEQARKRGSFNKLKGHGKPFDRDIHDHNPFLDNTEKLLNRIVQRQGGAPPWVEAQRELESALVTFRASIRDSWFRRSLRVLSTFDKITPEIVERSQSFRDPEWEQRERDYHATSVKSINELTRKYNIMAPQSIRRNFIVLEDELESCFREVYPRLKAELQDRLNNPSKYANSPSTPRGYSDNDSISSSLGSTSANTTTIPPSSNQDKRSGIPPTPKVFDTIRRYFGLE